MYLRRDHLKRTARAPAKLNLLLEVAGGCVGGFHELETLMVPIRLSDFLSLEATPPPARGGVGDICLDLLACWPVRSPPPSPSIPSGEENLVVRALKRLRERADCRWGARLELMKHIPAAAGLGGGSSDAAVALRLANRAWKLNWPADRLAEVAAEIGSDVPFFLSSGAAVCRGRGERVTRLPGMPPLHIVIVKPPADLSTTQVYQSFDALGGGDCRRGRLDRALASIRRGRWGSVGDWMYNRLQGAAAALSPWVSRLRDVFDRLDCLAHQLSGSGSAYFGICRHAQHARRLATYLKRRQLGLVYATRSCP